METINIAPASYCTWVYQDMLRRNNLVDRKDTTTKNSSSPPGKHALFQSAEVRPSAFRAARQRLRFWDLPGEIRNLIFQLAFTTDDTGNGERDYINLLDARPPTKFLLLVCRQANNEASTFYKAAYRSYWSRNEFVAHRTLRAFKSKPNPLPLKSQDLQAITSLRILSWQSMLDVLEAQQIITKDALRRCSASLRTVYRYQTDGTWDVIFVTPGYRSQHFIWPRTRRHFRGRLVQSERTPWYKLWDAKNWIKRWQSSSTEQRLPLPFKQQVDIILNYA